jgi:hypothetical protein
MNEYLASVQFNPKTIGCGNSPIPTRYNNNNIVIVVVVVVVVIIIIIISLNSVTPS